MNIKKLSLIFFALFFAMMLNAQNNILAITVSGEGSTKEDAIISGLRGALEQVYGAFISSDTRVVDEALIKDETVFVTNGSIKKYSVIAEMSVPGIGMFVTLRVEVSPQKISEFANNHGQPNSVSFDGNNYLMNRKLEMINLQAEQMAVEHLLSVVSSINNIWDYSLTINNENEDGLNASVSCMLNQNGISMISYIMETLGQLSSKTNNNKYSFLGTIFCLRGTYDNEVLNRSYYRGCKNLILDGISFRITTNDGQDIPYVVKTTYLGTGAPSGYGSRITIFPSKKALWIPFGAYNPYDEGKDLMGEALFLKDLGYKNGKINKGFKLSIDIITIIKGINFTQVTDFIISQQAEESISEFIYTRNFGFSPQYRDLIIPNPHTGGNMIR